MPPRCSENTLQANFQHFWFNSRNHYFQIFFEYTWRHLVQCSGYSRLLQQALVEPTRRIIGAHAVPPKHGLSISLGVSPQVCGKSIKVGPPEFNQVFCRTEFQTIRRKAAQRRQVITQQTTIDAVSDEELNLTKILTQPIRQREA